MDKIVDKGLQTEPNTKIKNLLESRQVNLDDLKGLDEGELVQFRAQVNKLARELDGEGLDELLCKLELVTCQKTKNEYWERNHSLIVHEISKYLKTCGRMPVIRELESLTGISRQTLTKHLKEYKKSVLYQDHLIQFQFMSHKVLAKKLQIAINGDIKAAKLYFEMIGERSVSGRSKDNYIQINNISISQEAFLNLPQDQLAKVEEIIFGCLKSQNDAQKSPLLSLS